MGTDQKIKVCHLISGDLWAGPEVQLYTLLCSLKNEPKLDLSVIIFNKGKLADKLQEAGFDTLVIDESIHGFFTIRRRLVRELQNKGIDILHSHRYKENVLAALVKKRCNIKHLLQTVHGIQEYFMGLKKLKITIYSRLNQYFTKRFFEKIIVVSSDIHNNLADIFEPDRLVTIHNAINTANLKTSKSATEVRKELRIEENQSIIGTAGRMVPIKGFDVLLKTAKLILEKKPMVRFLLAGEGPQKTELEQKARAMGLAEKVMFLGFRDDVIDIINCLDLFVMSSYHEGVPMSLLEAMALQKPVVATGVGGINEIIENDVSGFLVNPGDASALASACLKVLNDPVLKLNLAIAARKRIDEEFSIEVQSERVMKLYQDLVNMT
jgi:glycosyltransferase involved in cell wall biosynthesis